MAASAAASASRIFFICSTAASQSASATTWAVDHDLSPQRWCLRLGQALRILPSGRRLSDGLQRCPDASTARPAGLGNRKCKCSACTPPTSRHIPAAQPCLREAVPLLHPSGQQARNQQQAVTYQPAGGGGALARPCQSCRPASPPSPHQVSLVWASANLGHTSNQLGYTSNQPDAGGQAFQRADHLTSVPPSSGGDGSRSIKTGARTRSGTSTVAIPSTSQSGGRISTRSTAT